MVPSTAQQKFICICPKSCLATDIARSPDALRLRMAAHRDWLHAVQAHCNLAWALAS